MVCAVPRAAGSGLGFKTKIFPVELCLSPLGGGVGCLGVSKGSAPGSRQNFGFDHEMEDKQEPRAFCTLRETVF